MRWVVHGEQTIYDSDWLRLAMVDVEVPGGRRFDHHVVRTPQDASGTLVVDGRRTADRCCCSGATAS